jgi:hypothetical protein
MVADRPYGEFYDFYSVSSEYFGYRHVHQKPIKITISVHVLITLYLVIEWKLMMGMEQWWWW